MYMKIAPIVLLSLILLSPAVSAVGIGPGKATIDFEPGLNISLGFYVRSTMTTDMPVKVFIENCALEGYNISQYFQPSISEVVLAPGEVRRFDVRVSLPQKIERPGTYTCILTAMEAPENAADTGEGTGIGAYTGVGAMIYVRVPYPGRYLDIWFGVQNVNISDPVRFKIDLANRGLENVTASGNIKVTDDLGRNLATLSTNEKFIESQQSDYLQAVWDTTGIPPGRYRAFATVEYGGEKPATAGTDFKIGDILVRIINITYPDEINPDDIVRFEITLDSYWNEKIENIYVDMKAYKDGELVRDSRSETFEIDAWQSKKSAIFLDTDGFKEGEYTANFTVNYNGRTSEDSISFDVKQPQNPFIIWLIVAAVALAIAVVAIVIVKRRKKEKK